jgi:hypothetical protein
MLTPRDLAVLHSVAHYYTLTRAQISRLHFPEDGDGRVTRKRLQQLLDLRLLNRTRMEVVSPVMGAPAPVYYPSLKGCAFLAEQTEEVRYLRVCTQTPNWQHLYHWVQVADTHILLDHAANRTPDVRVEEWLGEWSVANPEEAIPEKRFRLYTLLRENPRLVCAPDAAFLLEKGGFRKVFYLEIDRDTTKSAQRVAASKCQGYTALSERQLHKKHFPATTFDKFSVLLIAPDRKRRDALRSAMSRQVGSELWKFAAAPDLTPESFLTSAVFHPCSGDPAPLVLSAKGGTP